MTENEKAIGSIDGANISEDNSEEDSDDSEDERIDQARLNGEKDLQVPSFWFTSIPGTKEVRKEDALERARAECESQPELYHSVKEHIDQYYRDKAQSELGGVKKTYKESEMFRRVKKSCLKAADRYKENDPAWEEDLPTRAEILCLCYVNHRRRLNGTLSTCLFSMGRIELAQAINSLEG